MIIEHPSNFDDLAQLTTKHVVNVTPRVSLDGERGTHVIDNELRVVPELFPEILYQDAERISNISLSRTLTYEIKGQLTKLNCQMNVLHHHRLAWIAWIISEFELVRIGKIGVLDEVLSMWPVKASAFILIGRHYAGQR